MAIEHVVPEDLPRSENMGYSQVVKTDARTTIYVAGQGAVDMERNLVGEGDYYAQTQQALKNVIAALAGAGAKPENVVSTVIYVVGLDEQAAGECVRAFQTALDGRPFHPGASSLIGVQRLMLPGMLTEISAIAALE